ncbi:MAG TPA: nucleotidyltransferase family protein [Candidatus Acidoferrum sp.]|nr:nucleotidyltransferase family protein [Candidatus Methylomirabilis sp.]HWU38218.1 nucleotidyltransferase family protein [Candidatus Acidoferrum sp.]
MTGPLNLSTIPIIILAAGASTRMGVPKQLLRHRGRTLLGHAVEAALGSTCRPIIVVLGANAEQIQPEIGGLSVHIVRNAHWAEGLSSSIRAGIEAVAGGPDPPEAVVLAVCDQPLVRSEDIQALVAAFRSTNRPIIASQYAGTLGVPALFARSVFPELLGLAGDRGAKQVIQRNAAAVWPVLCPHGANDVDTLEDWNAICSQ